MHRHIQCLIVAAVVVGCGGTTSTSPTAVTATPDTSAAPTTAAPSTPAAPTTTPADATTVPDGMPDPSEFVAVIDNPYLPLSPGSRWVYESAGGDEIERIVVEVTSDTRTIMGIEATVVRDTVTVDGMVVEDTWDWYAQDSSGNVWYLGEDTKEYEDGTVVSTSGSWEAGVDGAVAGILMEAIPVVGDRYRQEFYEGEAEDMAEVVRLGQSVSVPHGSFSDVIVIREWTPLEPGVAEEKYYAQGVGVILEVVVEGGTGMIELLEYEPGL